ncbi:MAG: T9SS type A sorting domain-containing protein [Saprospiraceae bacterium]
MKKSRKQLRAYFLFLCISILTTTLSAQGWERIFEPNQSADFPYSIGLEVFLDDNDGYIIHYADDQSKMLMWTDENGYMLDTMTLPVNGTLSVKDADNNIVIATRQDATALPDEDLALTKFDSDGNLLWEKYFGEAAGNEAVSSLILSADGGYIFAGGVAVGNSGYGHVYKVDSNGDLIWKETHDFGVDAYSYRLAEGPNGGVLVAVSNWNGGINNVHIRKFDALGNEEWETVFTQDMDVERVLATDNGYIFYGRSDTDPTMPTFEWGTTIITTDFDGQIIASEVYNDGFAKEFIQTTDGGYALLYDNFSVGDLFLHKIDGDLNTEWETSFGGQYDDRGSDLKQTPDGGYIITGLANQLFETGSMYLIKTDSNGVSLSNLIQGNVLYDINENCINDASEIPLESWIVTASGISGTYYGSVNANGYYDISTDTGTYVVSVTVPNDYWNSCTPDQNVTVGIYDTVNVDYPIQSLVQCPLMSVNMYSNPHRLCEENRTYVNVSNIGTWIAEDASVEITFDDSLTYVDSEIVGVLLGGNTYSFELDDIDFLESVNFWIDLQGPCGIDALGQTVCTEAIAFPDSTCNFVDPNWNGASLEARATCDGDSVHLILKNIGTANMSGTLEYFVVEDDVIMMPVVFGPLSSGDSVLVKRPADGTFYRIQTDQEPLHPGFSTPSAFMEGCNTSGGALSLGLVNAFPLDDADYNVDILCVEVVAAYDPNIKTAYPEGRLEEHFIEQNTDLEYVIQFQNTGSAMANLVIIEDQISSLLDPASIRPGVSSHPYTFDLQDDGTLRFTFENIMLPDSNANEPASHGFVQFFIAQQPDLPINTVINNEAAIYFDFNPAIITNETWHTIGELEFSVSIGPVVNPTLNVKVFPNPFAEKATFVLTNSNPFAGADQAGNSFTKMTFELFDATGRLIESGLFADDTYEFERNDLSSGLYFYRISSGDALLNSGTVAVGK